MNIDDIKRITDLPTLHRIACQLSATLDGLAETHVQLQAKTTGLQRTLKREEIRYAALRAVATELVERAHQQDATIEKLHRHKSALRNALSSAQGRLRVQGQELTQRRCAIAQLRAERETLRDLLDETPFAGPRR